VPQPTNLEVVDDTLGPLGPLGAAPSDDTLVEPSHEQVASQPAQQQAPSSQTALAGSMASVNLNDDDEEGGQRGPRIPPPVQPPQDNAPPAFRQTQPSVSIVEAAKPSFSIQVGDPHKVGDLTSAHTEYHVYTKVLPPSRHKKS
jgi:sorting nexin-1/2